MNSNTIKTDEQQPYVVENMDEMIKDNLDKMNQSDDSSSEDSEETKDTFDDKSNVYEQV